MNVTQRYEMQRGVERVTFHEAGECDQVLIITKGRIRFWYMRGKPPAQECEQPAKDCGPGEVCNVAGNRPFCFAALEPNTVVLHVW